MKTKYIVGVIVFLGITVMLLNSNTVIRYVFKSKVWAHRVNSVEKLHQTEGKFKGLELDIVFVNNRKAFFDIHHPPDSSMGLSLSAYFRSIHDLFEYQYWLDFKNLNSENELLSAATLDSVARVFNIDKSSIIVESTKPWLLKSFKKMGFRTSYYLPSNLRKLDSLSLKAEIEQISKNILLSGSSYISADYRDYPILKRHFPDSKKILWFTVFGSMNRFSARFLLYKILLDKNVDVLLIPPC